MGNRPFRRILVGWDCSADAENALRTAAFLVAGSGGHVVALAVLPPEQHAETREERAQEHAAHRKRVEDRFDAVLRRLATEVDAHLTLHLAESRHIATSLSDYAAEHGFDLIVVGRHGEGGTLRSGPGQVPRQLLGTTATALPVL